VNESNSPPILARIGNKTINEGDLLSFTNSAFDLDIPSQRLSYSLNLGAPAGASIDSASGVFAWRPSESQGPAAFSVTIRVTDNGSPPASAAETITITVNESNAPPVLPHIGDKTVNEGDLLSFTNSATDLDLPVQHLFYSLDPGAPAGAAINETNGLFTWTPTEAQGPRVYAV